MSDYKPKYVGYAPGVRPPEPEKQEKPVILRAVFHKDPVLNNPLTRPDNAGFPDTPEKRLANVHITNQLGGITNIRREAWQGDPMGNRGFWEDPQRVIRYKRQVDSGTAPLWVDPNVVNSAYAYFNSKYAGVAPEKWTFLPDDDPAVEILKSIPAPENPEFFKLENEFEIQNPQSQIQTGSWKNLGFAQQALQLTMNPGVVSGRSARGNTASKWISPVVNAAMMGMAGMGITKSPAVGAIVFMAVYGTEVARNLSMSKEQELLTFDANINPYTKDGSITSIAAGILSGVPSDAKWKRMSLSEKRIAYDRINKRIEAKNEGKIEGYDQAMAGIGKVFNFLSENAEQTLGALMLAVDEDPSFASVMDAFNQNSAARIASKLTYESGVLGQLPNDVAGFLSGVGVAKPGQVWKTSEGIRAPVNVNYKTGLGAIDEMRDRIEAGENPDAVVEEFQKKFGVEGSFNDFVFQTILDPLNFTPVVGGKIAQFTGKVTGDVRLQEAGRGSTWSIKERGVGTGAKPEVTARALARLPGKMVADIIPGANILLPILSKGRIQQSSGVMGALNAYKAFTQTNAFGDIVGTAELPRYQQLLSGLTKEGTLRTATPVGDKPKLWNVFKYNKFMSELDGVSKGLMFSYNVMDALAHTWESVGGDINKFRTALGQLAQVDSRMTGDIVNRILTTGEEPTGLHPSFLNSPIAVTAADSIKKFMEPDPVSGVNKFDEIVGLMDATRVNREVLSKLANAFGTTEAEIIKMMKNNKSFDEKYSRILDPNRKAMIDELLSDPQLNATHLSISEFMKQILAPFIKKSPVPYSTDLFGRQIAHSFYESMGEYMARRFNITEDGTMNRFFAALKSAQSVLLLGLNPRYMINNELNNIITRIATGVFGYVPDYNAKIDKYRLDVARGDIEANFMSLGDLEGLPKGIGDRNANARGKWMEGLNRGAKKINKKIGIFSKGSAALEGVESKNTFFIGFEDMYKKIFRPRLPDDMRARIDAIQPGLSRRIEAQARSSGNMDELLQSLQSDRVIPEQFISEVAQAYASSHQTARMTGDVYEGMFTRTHMIDELNEAFDGIVNPTEAQINTILDGFVARQMEYVGRAMKDSINTHLDDVSARAANQAETRDFTEFNRIMEEVVLHEQTARYNHLVELDNVYRLKGSMSSGELQGLIDQLNAREDARFSDLAEFNRQAHQRLLESIGVRADDPGAQVILSSFDQINKLNDTFNVAKREMFTSIQKIGLDDASYAVELDRVRTEVDNLSKDIVNQQGMIQVAVDRALVNSLGGDPAVVQWRQQVAQKHNALRSLVDSFREELKNTPLTPQEARARWNAFFMEQYQPKFAEIGELEVRGAQQIFNNREAVTDWFKESDYVTEPRIGDASGDMDLDTVIRSIYGDDVFADPNFDRQRFITELLDEAIRQNKDGFESTPPNAAPQPTPMNQATHESLYQHILPFLDSVREQMVLDSRTPRMKFSEIDLETQALVMDWARGLKTEMTQAKYASVRYGQLMRDLTMLNYQQKTNFDNGLNMVFPYQFWFTNTMRNWMLRSVDKASWFNTYFRYRQMQERLEKDGLPTRLSGKMSLPMPFLPDWMGDTVWFDPMAQLFPFAQLFQPFENFARKGSDIDHEAINKVYALVDSGELSRDEADKAINSKMGVVWEEAYAAATQEADTDPMTMASLMMSPAMWIDIPRKILKGRGEEISPTPMQKTSQALQAQADASMGAGSVAGKILGAPSWLETNIRKAMGMSPAVAKYGQFGDYYVERELANMAFDGRASLDEAQQAMISHTGALYDQADQAVARQLSLRTPGMLTIEALRGNADAVQTVNSFFTSFFSLGLLPQGELKYKGLQRESNKAWEIYEKTGDKTKVSEFYRDHPEMEARTALYENNPENRMKQYIIGKVWDVYGNASSADKIAIKNALGEDFITAFLQQDGGAEDSLSLETLMTFARRLNVMYPKPDTMELPGEPSVEVIERYSPEISTAYQGFVNTRDQLFPFWYATQQAYYDMPESERKVSKELKSYWSWKDGYIASHPEIAPVFESSKNVDLSKYGSVSLKDFDPALMKQLSNYYTTGETMSAGAWELLGEEWEAQGRPYNDFHRWMINSVQPAITGVAPKPESIWLTLGDDAYNMYKAYKEEKNKLFPGIESLQEQYFSYPDKSAERRAFLNDNPALKQSWEWDDQYETANPEIARIKKALSASYGK